MRIFYCQDHDGYWPVRVASLILAQDVPEAIALLDEQLEGRRLKTHKDQPYTLIEVVANGPKAIIINGGDY